jgi:hypothetical protein
MARKPREQQDERDQQAAEPYASAPAFNQMDVVDASVALVNQSPMMPSAADRDGCALAEVPPPRSYKVLQSQYVMSKGGRSILRAGKVVDELNFDIAALESQGVQLERVS